MSVVVSENLAEKAATESLFKVYDCIEKHKNFILEAGAGAGKTYSLIKALDYLIKKEGLILVQQRRKIACITYTNVAKEQIDSRTDKHPAIHSDTIHAFCWSLIRNFQPELRKLLPSIGKWSDRITESGYTVNTQVIDYDLGYPSIDENSITLYHADVLDLMVTLLENPKFRAVFVDCYPVLFIDEYQDTHKEFVEAIQKHFFSKEGGPLIGFFGDHWQKIYGEGCGKIEDRSLTIIDKNSNFRSVGTIVDVLNKMRPLLIQYVKDPEIKGEASIYHTNNWSGVRRTDNHWKGDLPPENAHSYLNDLKASLQEKGWDFSPKKTKILMLTHNVLADEQGYRNFANIFKYNDAFIKKENKHVAFFVDVVEPACLAYQNKHYGEMFSILKGEPAIQSYENKKEWEEIMKKLIELRLNGKVSDVIDYLFGIRRLFVPESVKRKEQALRDFIPDPNTEEPSSIKELRALRGIPYPEIISFAQFSNDHTPFATKHSVKGAEFENVLVVVGRGWNQYDFDQMLAWAGSTVPAGKQDTFERSRNLFYVVCSRPQKRLALLFTQKLSDQALGTLRDWFGSGAVYALST